MTCLFVVPQLGNQDSGILRNCVKKLAECEEREKTNKMQQSDDYYQFLSQHVLGTIMPIFRKTKTVCYCVWCTALVLLDVVGRGCGALPCGVTFPVLAPHNAGPHNRYLHSARTPQRSAPQPLPSQCSHPTTATFTVLAPHNSAPHNRYLHSARTLQHSAPQQLPSHCSHPTTQRPTTTINHIQQNQRSTPRAVTHVLFSRRWA